MKDPLKKLVEALRNNDLPAYLMGEKGYEFRDRLIEAPTDFGAIFASGLDAFAAHSKENKRLLELKLHEAFIRLLKEPEGTWWTVSLLNRYLFAFIEEKRTLSIDVIRLLPYINTSLKAFKEELKRNKNWVGYRFENGLWDSVVHSAERINERLSKDNSPMLIELGE